MGRILIIRGGAIGDFILTLPAIALLREAYPGNHVEILGYRHIVAIAEGRGLADASRSIEHAALSRFFVPGSDLPEDWVEYFGSFHQVISYLFDPDRFFESNLRRCGVKNLIVGEPRIDPAGRHAAEQLAQPLESLALFYDGSPLRWEPAEEDHRQAAALLGAGGQDWIAVHPGSGSSKKNLPVQFWVKTLGTILSKRPQTRFVLVGGEADFANLGALQAALPMESFVEAKNLPLPVLGAALQRCKWFLGHDTGVSHLAALAGTRCELFFLSTDPEIWAPRGSHVRTHRCKGGRPSEDWLKTFLNDFGID